MDIDPDVPLHIVELTVQDFRRIRAVRITPDGNIVEVSGRNGAGKSTVLNAIMSALAGRAGNKDNTEPVRDGAEQATIRVDLGRLIVTKTFSTSGSPKLIVEAPDGARYPKGQSVLDELLGELSFDPLAFVTATDKERRDILLGLVVLPFDPEHLAGLRQRAFEIRTAVGRDVDSLKGQLDGFKIPEVALPDREVPTSEILSELRAAEQVKRANDDARADADGAQRAAVAADAEVERLEALLFHARNDAIARHEHALTLQTALAQLPEDPDLAAFASRLDAAEAVNAAVRADQQRRSVLAAWEAKQEERAKLTEEIEGYDRQKDDGIAAAVMPIEGLGFTDDGVTYQGHPFGQASQAEQLRVSVAMAMAMNPTIRVIRITDGSLLDTESRAAIAQMAFEHDAQVWMEVVSETGRVGIVIEDGTVVASNPSRYEPPEPTAWGPGELDEVHPGDLEPS